MKKSIRLIDAFSPTPEGFKMRMERAFAEMEIRRRKKRFTRTLLSAASLLLLFGCVAAFAIVSGNAPNNDRKGANRRIVLSQGQSPSVSASAQVAKTPAPSAQASPTVLFPEPTEQFSVSPEPTVAPSVLPTSIDETISNIAYNVAATEVPTQRYWATQGGKYYHAFSDCSGMMGAKLMEMDEVLAMGKAACPVCVDNDTLSVEVIYAAPYLVIDTQYYGNFMVFDSGEALEHLVITDADGAGALAQCAQILCADDYETLEKTVKKGGCTFSRTETILSPVEPYESVYEFSWQDQNTYHRMGVYYVGAQTAPVGAEISLSTSVATYNYSFFGNSLYAADVYSDETYQGVHSVNVQNVVPFQTIQSGGYTLTSLSVGDWTIMAAEKAAGNDEEAAARAGENSISTTEALVDAQTVAQETENPIEGQTAQAALVSAGDDWWDKVYCVDAQGEGAQASLVEISNISTAVMRASISDQRVGYLINDPGGRYVTGNYRIDIGGEILLFDFSQ